MVSDTFFVGKRPVCCTHPSIDLGIVYGTFAMREKAKCVSGSKTLKLAVNLLAGKFWITLSTA